MVNYSKLMLELYLRFTKAVQQVTCSLKQMYSDDYGYQYSPSLSSHLLLSLLPDNPVAASVGSHWIQAVSCQMNIC